MSSIPLELNTSSIEVAEEHHRRTAAVDRIGVDRDTRRVRPGLEVVEVVHTVAAAAGHTEEAAGQIDPAAVGRMELGLEVVRRSLVAGHTGHQEVVAHRNLQDHQEPYVSSRPWYRSLDRSHPG